MAVPQEIWVRVKEYNTHSFLKTEKRFVGLRDTTAFSRLFSTDSMRVAYTLKRDKQDEPSYRFFGECYQWDDESSDNNPLSYDLDPSISNLQRARIWSIIEGLSKEFVDNGDSPIREEERRVNPPSLTDEERLDSIRNKYIDIFRKDPDDARIYLWAEYYADSGGKWHNVSVRNLSDNRQPEGGAGGDTIQIPCDQECYILLSRAKLKSTRLEEIRRRLEENGQCARVVKIPKTRLHASNSEELGNRNLDTEFYTRLQEIRSLKDSGSPIPETLYANVEGLENLMVAPGCERTLQVVLTDYKAYADTLREAFDAADEEYDTFIGDNTESDDDRLRYLIATTCAQQNAWNQLASSEEEGLRNNYTSFEDKIAERLWLAEQLAWWIVQPGFSEVMYDYASGSSEEGFTQDIYEYCSDLIEGLAEVPSAIAPLKRLCSTALDDFERALQVKNADTIRRYHNDPDSPYSLDAYWDWNQGRSRLNDNFADLELYSSTATTPNFFVEILYPRAKTTIDVSLKVLECLSKPIVWANGERFGGKLPDQLAGWLTRLAKTNQVVVEEFVSTEARYWGEFDVEIRVVSVRGRLQGQTTADKILNSRLTKAIQKAMVSIDLALCLKRMSEQGLTLENSIGLIKTSVSFAKTYHAFSNKTVNNSTSRATTLRGNRSVKTVGSLYTHFTDIADIILGAIDFYKLGIENGDWDAAIVRGGGSIAVAILGIVFASNPVAGVILIFAGLGVNILGTELVNDEFEKWIKFGRLGKKYPDLTDGEHARGWPDFHRDYVFSDTRQEDAYNISAINFWRRPENQIRVYQRLLYNFTVNRCQCYYFDSSRSFTGYQLIELKLTTRLLLANACYTVDILEYPGQEGEPQVVLTDMQLSQETCIVEQPSGDIEITTYIYQDRDVLRTFLENYRVIGSGEAYSNNYLHKTDLSDVPPPENDVSYYANGFIWPDLRLRISLRMVETEEETSDPIIVKEQRLPIEAFNDVFMPTVPSN